MYISRELKKKNIAEYLLYMWQIEDMVRAKNFSIEELKKSVIDVANHSEDDIAELTKWYVDIIEMMHTEGVVAGGHLQINKNIIAELTELHLQLLASTKYPYYSAAYYNALPFIVEYRNKSNGQEKPEIENCFEAMYALWMLKLQKKEISKETTNAIEKISKLLSMLALYNSENSEGKLELD